MVIPSGFRFAPTDEDLIMGYLRRKAKGEALPFEGVVVERDIYSEAPWNVFNDQDPWNTFKIKPKKYEHIIYVFTKLKKIGAKRRVIRRADNCGTWDGRTSFDTIYNERKEHIGFKKMLIFEADANKKDECLMHARGHWIMHEYSLGGVSLDGIDDDHDYVLCKIKRDDSKPLKTSTKHGRDDVSGSSKAIVEDPTHKKMRYDHEASTPQSSCACPQTSLVPSSPIDIYHDQFINFNHEQISNTYEFPQTSLVSYPQYFNFNNHQTSEPLRYQLLNQVAFANAKRHLKFQLECRQKKWIVYTSKP